MCIAFQPPLIKTKRQRRTSSQSLRRIRLLPDSMNYSTSTLAWDSGTQWLPYSLCALDDSPILRKYERFGSGKYNPEPPLYSESTIARISVVLGRGPSHTDQRKNMRLGGLNSGRRDRKCRSEYSFQTIVGNSLAVTVRPSDDRNNTETEKNEQEN